MRGFEFDFAGLVGLAASLAATSAHACTPLPPSPIVEGETREAYADRLFQLNSAAESAARARRIAHEENLLATSGQIVLARVVGSHLRSRQRRVREPRVSDIEFVVIAVERGGGRPSRFRVPYEHYETGSCDFDGRPSSLYGLGLDDLVLVFATSGELGAASFREAVDRQGVMSPAVRALFDRLATAD